jgi:hypothetical protein
MAVLPSRPLLPVAAWALAASLAGALHAQPARLPASVLGPPAQRFASHPYKSALGAVANYRSCGIHVRAAAYAELSSALRSIETEAVAKGLGAELARLRQEYYELLSVSTMAACGGGPVRALADARRALAAFRAWVAGQPDR